MHKLKLWVFCFLIISPVSASPVSASVQKKQLWVYTSIYKEFAAPIKQAFEKQYPNIEVNIFQAGSEKIQTKIEAELLAKKTQADIVLVSDPFWPSTLSKRGLLHSRTKHPTIETNYYSLMIIVCHKDMPVQQRPKSFIDFTKPEFKKLIQFGSPLESGTMFVTIAYLSQKYGWEYFEKLRDNQLASQGGNSTVIQKIESGEKKIGIVLLENALAALKRGSPIDIVYPTDGGIPIPSVQVILKDSPSKEEASVFADFLLSKEGQMYLRNGFMYSVNKDVPPPEGAKNMSLATNLKNLWTEDFVQKISLHGQDIKKKFSKLILE
ncbi:MAG: extracellular solute-binding protein [Bdellovibrio sp.]|nr:extracellular solute-binding protein [Bdellovibrio sp.]